MHPMAFREEFFLTLITGSIPLSWSYLKFALESYAPSATTLLTSAFDDVCRTRGCNILPSPTSSLVTSTESIFPVFTSTATWNLTNPLFTAHFYLIHSPLLETLIPVGSTAIVV